MARSGRRPKVRGESAAAATELSDRNCGTDHYRTPDHSVGQSFIRVQYALSPSRAFQLLLSSSSTSPHLYIFGSAGRGPYAVGKESGTFHTLQPWLLDLKRHGRGPSASSVDHSPLPFFRSSSRSGVIIEGRGHHRGARTVYPSWAPVGHRPIFGYSCKSRISHPRLSLNIKAPRGLTIPRSRSSNFEAG